MQMTSIQTEITQEDLQEIRKAVLRLMFEYFELKRNRLTVLKSKLASQLFRLHFMASSACLYKLDNLVPVPTECLFTA